MNPLVSVIILTWNGKDLLRECLSSLASQTYSEKEVIVVDNGSTDGTVQFVKGTFGTLVSRVIENTFNTGFSKGCNQGIQASKGELVAFLNNDCRAQPGWIETMVRAALSHPEAGMFACKILLSHDPSLIDNAGHLLFPDGLNFSRGRLERDIKQYDRSEEVFFPSGAASVFRRELLLDIKGFDEDFFAYGDDADLGLRARLRGWSCLYVPDARMTLPCVQQ
jgi:GT2 family glycosyltransferase